MRSPNVSSESMRNFIKQVVLYVPMNMGTIKLSRTSRILNIVWEWSEIWGKCAEIAIMCLISMKTDSTKARNIHFQLWWKCSQAWQGMLAELTVACRQRWTPRSSCEWNCQERGWVKGPQIVLEVSAPLQTRMRFSTWRPRHVYCQRRAEKRLNSHAFLTGLERSCTGGMSLTFAHAARRGNHLHKTTGHRPLHCFMLKGTVEWKIKYTQFSTWPTSKNMKRPNLSWWKIHHQPLPTFSNCVQLLLTESRLGLD